MFLKHLLGCYSCHLYQAPLRVFCYTYRGTSIIPMWCRRYYGNGLFPLLCSQLHFHQTISNIIIHIIDTNNIQETCSCYFEVDDHADSDFLTPYYIFPIKCTYQNTHYIQIVHVITSAQLHIYQCHVLLYTKNFFLLYI